MPSITREQAQKLNAQAPGEWSFDVRHYVLFGDKTLIRNIELGNGDHLQARLIHTENRGFSRYARTGHYHIDLHLSVFKPSSVSGLYMSSGFGQYVDMDHAQHPKRNYKDLCKIAETLDDTSILTLADVKTEPDDLALLQLPS